MVTAWWLPMSVLVEGLNQPSSYMERQHWCAARVYFSVPTSERLLQLTLRARQK